MRLSLSLLPAVFAITVTAAAQDIPTLKAGQWEMSSSQTKTGAGAANPPTKTTMCTDAAMQKELVSMGAGMSKEMCSKHEMKREGARVVTTSECKIGESKISSRAVMTLSGDTGYKTEISATYDPPFMGMKDSRSTIEGKYVGPCRDGLVPGRLHHAQRTEDQREGCPRAKVGPADAAAEDRTRAEVVPAARQVSHSLSHPARLHRSRHEP